MCSIIRLIKKSDRFLTLAFSPNGEYLASGSSHSNIDLWRVQSGELIKTFRGHSLYVSSVVF